MTVSKEIVIICFPIHNQHFFYAWQAALDYLYSRSSVDSRRIMVFGRSLGGAVGAALVRDNPGKVDYSQFITWQENNHTISFLFVMTF